jgi:hypothetical protein
MNRKVLAALGVVVIIGIVLALVLTGKRDRYNAEEVASLQGLVAKSDLGYRQLESTDTTVLRSFTNIFMRQGSADSNLKLIDGIMDARRAQYPVIRQQLDSIEHQLRDSSSAFTKGLLQYVQTTRLSVQQFEQQLPMLAILHDQNAMMLPPQQEAPTPVQTMPGGATLPAVAPPMALPLIENLRVVEQLKPERERAKAIVAQGYH